MRGDRLGAMLPRRERRAGGTVESTQVDRAEGPKRERAEGPKRAKRTGPFKLPARGVQAGASGQERAGEAS